MSWRPPFFLVRDFFPVLSSAGAEADTVGEGRVRDIGVEATAPAMIGGAVVGFGLLGEMDTGVEAAVAILFARCCR